MSEPLPPLSSILGLDLVIDVVDIGANPIDGDPPYKAMLERGEARLVGFEPNPDALERLNRAKGPHETYLPHAVADGGRHLLNLCQAEGMSSLLTPNQPLLGCFHGFPEWGKVVSQLELDTVRLDDVAEITNLDFLKIDIQGGELMVFQNAPERLAQCLVIQTEVEFLPLYEGQPLFSEVELFLRSQGFVFHRFWPLLTRTLQPMVIDNSIYRGLAQVTDGDAIFVRDFARLDRLDAVALLKLATLMHDIYQSFDLVLRVLMEHDRREGTGYASRYMGGQDISLA